MTYSPSVKYFRHLGVSSIRTSITVDISRQHQIDSNYNTPTTLYISLQLTIANMMATCVVEQPRIWKHIVTEPMETSCNNILAHKN